MAFWGSASQPPQRSESHRPGPAVPVTAVMLSASGDFSALVRLRVNVSNFEKAESSCPDDSDDVQACNTAVSAVSSAHQLIMDIERDSAEAGTHSIIEVLSPDSLQLLCQKAVVARVYKSLMPLQSNLGFSLQEVKKCISLAPLGLWELHEALQTAMIKAVTGSSSGTCFKAQNNNSSDGADGPKWMCLSRNKLVGCNMLTAAPGAVLTTVSVEFEARGQPPNKVLLFVKSAGTIKFRSFSPMQALAADLKALKLPLQCTDTDHMLLSDPAKLAAAGRQLEGQAVKLLPDERCVFIKSLSPSPTSPLELQRLSSFWLGLFGLQLPTKYPFLVGVAAHPEAEAAELQVPSCCVLSNMGLSMLPGSALGGEQYNAAVQQLLEGLQGSKLHLWGAAGLKVEVSSAAAGTTGLSDAQMQFSSPDCSNSVASSIQPKHFFQSAAWTTAKDLGKLQAAAQAEPAAGSKVAAAAKPLLLPLTTNAAQLLGLQEVQHIDGQEQEEGAIGSSKSSHAQQRQRPVMAACKPAKDWSKLNEYLDGLAKERQQQRQTAVVVSGGIAKGLGVSSNSSNAGQEKGSGATTAVAAAAAARLAAAGGAVAGPKFTSRKPTGPPVAVSKVAKPVAAVKTTASKTTVGKTPVAAAAAADPVDDEDSFDTPAGGNITAAATGTAALAVAVKAPVVHKRQLGAVAAAAAAVGAGGKPAAKKPKTAAGSKPKAAKQPSTAATGSGIVDADARTRQIEAPTAAADSGEAAVVVPAGAAAASDGKAAAPKRAKTKASDLDIAVVTTKIVAAFADGGGTSLKGASVPEMQCYLRAQGVKGGSAKRADVEAKLLALLASNKLAA